MKNGSTIRINSVTELNANFQPSLYYRVEHKKKIPYYWIGTENLN